MQNYGRKECTEYCLVCWLVGWLIILVKYEITSKEVSEDENKIEIRAKSDKTVVN